MTTPNLSPPDLLAAIGRALYGEQWQKPLADELEINRETIRRWLTGHTPLAGDHGVFEDLARIARERAATLEMLLASLPAGPEKDAAAPARAKAKED